MQLNLPALELNTRNNIDFISESWSIIVHIAVVSMVTVMHLKKCKLINGNTEKLSRVQEFQLFG